MKQHDQEADKAAAISRLQRLATEADDAGGDQAAATYTLTDPEALESEAERIKVRQQEFLRREREQREQRARERVAATERNEKAMQAQREADTSDAQRRVEKARARAAAAADAESVPDPPRKRPGSRKRDALATARALAEVNADDPAAILAAVARAVWHNAHAGAECPAAAIPTPKALMEWLPKCPADVRVDFGVQLDAISLLTTTDSLLATATLLVPHRLWLAHPEPRPRHPLAPLVDAWQRLAPVPVEVDRRKGAILPAPLRNAQRDPATLPLTLDRSTPLGPIREPEQGYLPGLAPPSSLVPPVPWLTLYDLTARGPMQTRGRGAPLAQRLFVEVLTAVHVGDRGTAAEWTTAPPVTLGDLFAWCWPRYYDRAAGRMRGGYKRTKHLAPLVRALVELDNMRIEHEGMLRRLIRVDDLPASATPLDAPIRFHVRHLPGSDRGPMIDRASMRRWGVVSAPAWRAAVRLAYLWDEAKRRNNGARVYATRPMVARGPGGVVLGADRLPLRDRRGAVVSDWSDRRAVLLGADGKPAGNDNAPAFERNPAADRLPELGPDDLIRLAFNGNLATNRRKRLHLARQALTAMEAAGEVVIERGAGGAWRIIEVPRRR